MVNNTSNIEFNEIENLNFSDLDKSTSEVLKFYKSYKNINPEKCVGYLALVYNQLKENRQTKDNLEIIYALAHCNYLLGNLEAAKSILLDAISYLDSCENLVLVAETYLLNGILHYVSKDHIHALRYFFKAVDLNFNGVNANAYLHIGRIYIDKKQYEQALNFTLKAEGIVRRLNDNNSLVNVFINLGTIYRLLNQNYRAIPYLEEAVRIITEQNILTLLDDAYEQLAMCKLEMKEYDIAEELTNLGIGVCNKTNNYDTKCRLLNIKAKVHLHQEKFKNCAEAIAASNELISNEFLNPKDLKLSNYFCSKNLAIATADQEAILYFNNKIIELQQEILDDAYNGSFLELLNNKNEEFDILEEKNKRIAQQNLELSQYSYVVAHDLKEPVRVINSFANLIQRRYGDQCPEEILEYLNFITAGARNMNEKLANLLTYVEIDENCDKHKIDLNKIVKEVLQECLKSHIDEHNPIIEVSDLPTVFANSKIIRQLFFHLINNSIKFKDKERPLKISIYSYEAKGSYNITINDNGIGIEEKYHQLVFGLFKKLDRKIYEGTGIGLAISKKIVESSGGRIWIESVLGNGTTVQFTFPNK